MVYILPIPLPLLNTALPLTTWTPVTIPANIAVLSESADFHYHFPYTIGNFPIRFTRKNTRIRHESII